MKNKAMVLLCLLCSVGLLFAKGSKESSAGQKKQQVREMFGYELPQTVPQRTVAGQVVLLDMLDYLGVEVVAVPTSDRITNPKHADKPRIGSPMTPDGEKLKAANPDFFLSTDNVASALSGQVKAMGIPAVFLRTSTYRDLLDTMLYLGEVYGKQEKARAYVQEVEDFLAKIKADHQNEKSIKVLAVFGTPGSLSIATANHSFVGSLVKAVGGYNIWQDETIKNAFVPLNQELVLAENPDVILVATYPVGPGVAERMFKKEFSNDFWTKLDAVKNNRLYHLDFQHFGIAGSIHIKESLEILSNYFYGK